MIGYLNINDIPHLIIVFICCAGLLFIWPRIVFNKFLHGKGILYKVFFCTSIMFVLCNATIILFYFIGILNQITVCVTFYGVLTISLVVQIIGCFKKKIEFKNPVKNLCNRYIKRFSKEYKSNPRYTNAYIELTLNALLIIIFAGLMYYLLSYVGTYECTDMKIHKGWIQQIFDGKLYNDGVYPFGMHFIIYIICEVFGLNLNLVNLYICTVACFLFLLALYCFLRGTLKSKITIIAIFVLFLLTIRTTIIYQHYDPIVFNGVNRFRFTVPNEFCYFAVLIAPLCIKKIIDSTESIKSQNCIALLILLSLCIGTTICTHYYSLIFQAILCFVMFFVNISKCKKQKFLGLLFSVIAGFLTTCVPLGMALIKNGGKFAYSIQWAIQLPNKNDPIDCEGVDVTKSDVFSTTANSFYDDALSPLFHHQYVIPFLIALTAGLCITVFCLIKKDKFASSYLYACLCVIIFMVLYSAPVLNLTRFIESLRVVVLLYVHICMVSCIFIDFLLGCKTKTICPNKTALL